MNKTVTVLVERRVMHGKYKKYVKKSAKYAAHDEANACKEGDFVQIEECRPISKNKSWKVIEGRSSDGKPVNVVPFNPTERVNAAPEKKAVKPAAKAKKAPEASAKAKAEAKPAAEKKPAAKKEAKVKS